MIYKIACRKAACQKEDQHYFTKFNYHVALPKSWQYTKLYKKPRNKKQLAKRR
jgi:hypothetical protein